jgi:arabinogalactan endo-1,4-beta-galactosidase
LFNSIIYKLKIINLIFFTIIVCIFFSCKKTPENPSVNQVTNEFYLGADLSYVNEMEDCGAYYKNSQNEELDVFKIFKDHGANLVRVRLWHNPTWTNYSNLEDVKKTIPRAKNYNLQVLLDFHYSDTWADPNQQEIPLAWESYLSDDTALSNILYQYTFTTLQILDSLQLLPEIVQIGNEINPMILQKGNLVWPINWTRNALLLNKGIEAVRNYCQTSTKNIEIMLHIAQPENGLWWYNDATNNGVVDFDWIGLSYYPQWSQYDFSNLEEVLYDLRTQYNKKLMIVETAYPYTLNNYDSANNILGSQSLLANYNATQQGQLDYLLRLKEIISNSGGSGLVYWEPAWVSTNCNTLWGNGSHWENATLFDQNYVATKGMEFYNNSK